MMKSLALCCIMTLSSLISAQNTPDLTFNVDGKKVNLEEFLTLKNINGISIYMSGPNGEKYQVQSGKRDVKNDLPVEQNTLFQAGSMTSAITHFAVLRLVNDGKIELDGRANDYLKSWKINKKGFSKKNPVTVRDLLLHKRGFNKAYKLKGYKPGSSIPTLLQTLNGEDPSQESRIRLKKSDNKGGNSFFANTLILQQLLEDVHGQPLTEIMQREVFEPLQMNNSVLRQELTTEEKKNAAIGYDQNGAAIPGDRWIYPEEGHSGLWCTPEDYGRFAQQVMAAAAGKDNRFLSKELAQASVTPQHGRRSLIFLKWDNLGWGGASRGFRTQFDGSTEENWVAVIFINSHENWQAMGQLQSVCGKFLSSLN